MPKTFVTHTVVPMPQHFAVIIAGGKGERFWPQSRERRPKHLLPIVGDKPMLAQTLDRIRPVVPPKNTFVITSAAQEKAVRQVCGQLPRANIVAEPVGRDTAPAVALAAALVGARDPRGVFAVLPSDHVIPDAKVYLRDLRAAFAAAEAEPVLVTIGIKPTIPETGYGYIQLGKDWKKFGGAKFSRVKQFKEKPPLKTARRYVASGDYAWNAGMFVWSVPVVETAFEKHAPDYFSAMKPVRDALAKRKPIGAALKKVYSKIEKLSVDYALLEKADNVVVLPAAFSWDDVGSWSAVQAHCKLDADGNALRGPALVEQGRGNIVFSESGHLTALLGADDMIVVHTKDATLIAPKSKAQEVKKLATRIGKMKNGQMWL
ncbi:mannose-1-phosphate guanylyltransferase [Ereboglobus sp. PH5-10]|uniref:mannose-1-phosphate guanylyltransferase n=1 Tax=Ereboglobus sp. PH5-10 TaxID=2940629 RepID=UPI0024054A03|nr:mannose-1-phosphate guanylyltransferase [Ereboglobus sp. PH5-10]MDF9828055.1 mannose-1-phosphate guanylyltransferase [Ereboglobus sp. PH5-10]